MGEHDTSIVIAAILQRGGEIKSAGGYLRVLTAKARAGEFSLGPVLMALLRGKAAKAMRERRRPGDGAADLAVRYEARLATSKFNARYAGGATGDDRDGN